MVKSEIRINTVGGWPLSQDADGTQLVEVFPNGWFDFKGRISRLTFLWRLVVWNLCGLVAAFLFRPSPDQYIFLGALIIFPVAFSAALRAHDMNRSGFSWLMLPVPVVGLVWSLRLLLVSGSEGANKFGAVPGSVIGAVSSKMTDIKASAARKFTTEPLESRLQALKDLHGKGLLTKDAYDTAQVAEISKGNSRLRNTIASNSVELDENEAKLFLTFPGGLLEIEREAARLKSTSLTRLTIDDARNVLAFTTSMLLSADSSKRRVVASLLRRAENKLMPDEADAVFDFALARLPADVSKTLRTMDEDANDEEMVVVPAASSMDCIQAEYAFLDRRYGAAGTWSLRSKSFLKKDGKAFDVMTISLKDGSMKTIWFDITSTYQ